MTDEEREEEREETGWKLVHADVFRPPLEYPMLFCVSQAIDLFLIIHSHIYFFLFSILYFTVLSFTSLFIFFSLHFNLLYFPSLHFTLILVHQTYQLQVHFTSFISLQALIIILYLVDCVCMTSTYYLTLSLAFLTTIIVKLLIILSFQSCNIPSHFTHFFITTLSHSSPSFFFISLI